MKSIVNSVCFVVVLIESEAFVIEEYIMVVVFEYLKGIANIELKINM